jgi:predicted nucleic-acid-binding protein
MTGLDTNVLVRYLAQDDPAQARTASRFIEEQCSAESPGFINHIVLCELIWVLKRCYAVKQNVQYPVDEGNRYTVTIMVRKGILKSCQEQALQVIEQLLRTVQFKVQDPEVVWAALRQARNGKADFPDCLIGRINISHGCQETVTFDQAAAEIDGISLLETT